MSQTILLPENHSLMTFYFLRTCNDASTWLPRYRRSHIFSTFLCNRLNKTLWIRITFRWTYKRIHHLISGNAFSSIFGFDIKDEEVSIRSPWEPGIIGKCLLILIKGDFINKIKLHIKLDEGAIFCDNIKILLSGGKWGSCDSVLIFCFDVNIRFGVNGENRSSLSNT